MTELRFCGFFKSKYFLKVFCGIVFLIPFYALKAQENETLYFVYFTNKTNSTFSLSKPADFLSERSINRRKNQNIKLNSRDLPVNNTYLNQLKSEGVKVIGSSKWLNAALIRCTSAQIEAVKKLSFIKGVEGNTNIKGLRTSSVSNQTINKFGVNEDFNYGNAQDQIKQIGADNMHKKGFTGKDILIGVLDSGFENADKMDAFQHLFKSKRVVMTYDFVDNEVNVFNDHNHGTLALSCISANINGKHIGTAPDASLVLFRTEDVFSETKIEEVYWLFAAEKADSIGVDVINSSLGYYTFDNPVQNYTYNDMNGDKTISAKAADFAVSTGMMVVCSAGNEGNAPWKYVVTPADADSVISVGAVDALGNPSGFTSFGPNFKGSIKPELAARGSSTSLVYPSNTAGFASGTSFSSPLIAGFFASLMQAYPSIPVMKLRELLIKSASKFNNPDTRVGYGIPSFNAVEKLAEEYFLSQVMSVDPNLKTSALIFPNPVTEKSKIHINGKEINENQILSIIESNGKSIKSQITYKDFNKFLNQNLSTNFFVVVNIEGERYFLKVIK